MFEIPLITLVVIFFALIFALTNGWNDSANAIATVVSTRVMSPWTAIVFGAVLNFAGALFSSEVADTVGKKIVNPVYLNSATYLAAVLISPIWVTLCTIRGLPISCSHSLMGGLIGAVLATVGTDALKSEGVNDIVFGIFTSPIVGFLLAWLMIHILYWVCQKMRPSTVGRVFGRLQIFSAGAMAFSHGTGDAQKAMGIISAALVTAGALQIGSDGKLPVPVWVRLLCAIVMGVGTAVGGWRVIKTLGMRLANLKPHHGFVAETAAATTILANTLTGVPISTTHSITGAIMGVGAAHGIRTVKWGIGGKIFFAWIVTFPVCIGGGALFYWLLQMLGVR